MRLLRRSQCQPRHTSALDVTIAPSVWLFGGSKSPVPTIFDRPRRSIVALLVAFCLP